MNTDNNKPKGLLCSLNLHKYDYKYDMMYDEHTRTCERCGKTQYARVITLEIKWQNHKTKRNTYEKQY